MINYNYKRTDTSLIFSKLKNLGYTNYKEYLKSKHWQDVKNRYYKSKLPKRIDGVCVCKVCNEKKSLSLHHRTYKNMGNERLNDLILLCQECHHIAHIIHNENKELKGTQKYNTRLNLHNSFQKVKRWKKSIKYRTIKNNY